MTTVREAAARLAAAGVPSPRHDAEALARHVLGRRSGPTGTELGRDYDRLIARRAAREPLQHIVGTAPFRHLEILVGPGVFVPRPETELVAGFVIEAVRGLAAPVVVDLCTGPGTIALAVASEVSQARVYGVDIDPHALSWARRNGATQGIRVTWCETDARTALAQLDAKVDAVVANPPYIAAADARRVDPEARDHEPGHALFAGPDGLHVIRQVIATAHRLLVDGGTLVVEHADDQGDTVPALLREYGGFVGVTDHRDLTGRDRFTTARRRVSP